MLDPVPANHLLLRWNHELIPLISDKIMLPPLMLTRLLSLIHCDTTWWKISYEYVNPTSNSNDRSKYDPPASSLNVRASLISPEINPPVDSACAFSIFFSSIGMSWVLIVGLSNIVHFWTHRGQHCLLFCCRVVGNTPYSYENIDEIVCPIIDLETHSSFFSFWIFYSWLPTFLDLIFPPVVYHTVLVRILLCLIQEVVTIIRYWSPSLLPFSYWR